MFVVEVEGLFIAHYQRKIKALNYKDYRKLAFKYE